MDLLVRDIPWIEPAAAFSAWAGDPHVAFFDSLGPFEPRARHSYLAVEPFARFEVRNDTATLDGQALTGNVFEALAATLADFRLPSDAAPLPFAGGVSGFFGYELSSPVEGPRLRYPAPADMPDCVLGLYDLVIGFDRLERRAFIFSSGFPAEKAARRVHATARADDAERRLARLASCADAEPVILAWREEIPRADYHRRVARIIEHIRAGDIYQANFTARHLAPRPPGVTPDRLYRLLREASPAPFGAYLGCGPALSLGSASPERFVWIDPTGYIETRPIKGTRPRSRDPDEDARQRQALADSAKDRAENLMIVDLMRNDIGRAAEIGSVAVPTLCEIESFPQVHHLVSSVTGRLRAGLGPVDVLRATLPGGSITGAPRRRAMEIIDAVEIARRGPYCGALAWIGFDGAMDSSILIRTLVITPDQLIAQAGGGIVADSDPAAEYEEMMVKVAPLLLRPQ